MTHGLMFHYFHNDEVHPTQGSIGACEFEKIIDYYAKNHNIIDAQDYLRKAMAGKLNSDDVCITFDDGLYSQYAVAEQVLKKKGLTAFYFVYTSPMEGLYEKIEVYRMFRNNYVTMDAFYEDFFNTVICYGQKKGIDYSVQMNSSEAKSYHMQYEYYSEKDRIFRFFRDVILKDKYDEVMGEMMDRGFNLSVECKNIWIAPDKLVEMRKRGNVIGLHSHTHPTTLDKMTYEQKLDEYSVNKKLLESIAGEIKTASYPCDAYDKDSDEILTTLGIELAFIAHMENEMDVSLHKIPRLDASALIQFIS